MILVDTSVFVDYLKNTENSRTALFQQILDDRIEYGINYHIYMELLQGAEDEKEFKLLDEYLSSLRFYSFQDRDAAFRKAVWNNFLCRKKGITIRSTVDLIIAQTAIEHGLFVLHNDTDFDKIASIIPELKIFHRL